MINITTKMIKLFLGPIQIRSCCKVVVRIGLCFPEAQSKYKSPALCALNAEAQSAKKLLKALLCKWVFLLDQDIILKVG